MKRTRYIENEDGSITLNNLRFNGFLQHQKKCSQCHRLTVDLEDFDARACLVCNIWLEEKSLENSSKIVQALLELEFTLTERQILAIQSGQDFVQLKNGPFDLDLIFAPDGIETFAEAWTRQVVVNGFRVCSLDDIIASKEATGRKKDLES